VGEFGHWDLGCVVAGEAGSDTQIFLRNDWTDDIIPSFFDDDRGELPAATAAASVGDCSELAGTESGWAVGLNIAVSWETCESSGLAGT